jgi:hypothetical protein
MLRSVVRSATCCALLLGGLLTGPAHAAVGDLSPVGGRAGCLTLDRADVKRLGCRAIRGLDGPLIADYNPSTVLSADGRSAYVWNRRGIAAFDLRPDGARQLGGKAGCFTVARKAPCTTLRGMAGHGEVSSLDITPDGRFVVFAGAGNGLLRLGPIFGVVGFFARDLRTGALTQLAGLAGCLRSKPRDGCGVEGRLAPEPRAVIAPDGARVVVVSGSGDGPYHVLSLALSEEGIHSLPACLSRTRIAGCTQVRLPLGRSISFDPTGGRLFSSRFLTCGIDDDWPQCTGAIVQEIGLGNDGALSAGGCLSNLFPGCIGVRGLFEPEGLVFSRDGRSAYLAGNGSLLSFAVDPTTGALTQLPDAGGCLVNRDDRVPGCGTLPWLASPIAVSLSPDGGNLYAIGGYLDGLLVGFDRDQVTGALAQHPGAGACLTGRHRRGCRRTRLPRDSIYGVRVSPDGGKVYVDGYERVVVFNRQR